MTRSQPLNDSARSRAPASAATWVALTIVGVVLLFASVAHAVPLTSGAPPHHASGWTR